MKNLLKKILGKFKYNIISHSNYQKLKSQRSVANRAIADISFLSKLPDEQVPFILKNLKKSKSQLRQDLFVLSQLKGKQNGFFVEFGSTNGVDVSNTFLLEKEFGWRGILAEPAKCWHGALEKNRSCHLDKRCVWNVSGSAVVFNEVDTKELSTIDSFSFGDVHKEARKKGQKYKVKTITLLDLLDYYQSPKEIDYLSIDTEGSEFEILSVFDFEKYKFKVITCEHNFTPIREKIFKLLTSQNYVRIYEDVSFFDDWYVAL